MVMLWAWHGASLLFDDKAVQLDFERLGAPGEEASNKKLTEQLEARAKMALAAGMSMGLDVYIHQDTPWETVVALLNLAVGSGFRAVGLVFEGNVEARGAVLTFAGGVGEGGCAAT